MAKITPGVGFSSASGSVAGVTYTSGRSGLVMRNRLVTPQLQRAPSQLKRAQFAAVAQSWRELSAADRLAWKRFAESIVAGGDDHQLGGGDPRLVFQQCNMNRLELGSAMLTTPAVLQVHPRVTLVPTLISVLVGSFNFSFTRTAAGSGTNMVYATRPLSPGQYHHRGRVFRFLRSPATNTDLNYFGNYSSAWSASLTSYAGRVVYMRSLVIGTDGLKSQDNIIRVVLDP